MSGMFRGATSATPDTSGWNTALVTDMHMMFNGATSANPDTASWDISNVTTMEHFLTGVTIPTTDYDTMLIGFDAQALINPGTFSGGNSTYCTAETQRQNMIDNDGWVITDGGRDCSGIIVTDPTNITISPNPASNGDMVTVTMAGIAEGSTVTVAGMTCNPTPTDASGNVTCTGTVGQNGLDGINTTITVTNSIGNTNTNTNTGLVVSAIRADVDQNSFINTVDALLTLRNSLGLNMTNTNWQSSITTGDVNCDGNTNSTDASLILRSSLGLDMGGTGWCTN
jgi:hypothetical protein